MKQNQAVRDLPVPSIRIMIGMGIASTYDPKQFVSGSPGLSRRIEAVG